MNPKGFTHGYFLRQTINAPVSFPSLSVNGA
jgi:hypothetical protein